MTILSLPRHCRRAGSDVGATMLEYALVLTLIALVVMGAAVSLGPAVSDLFTEASSSL